MEDFILTVGKCRLVEQHQRNIEDLFDVDVKLPPLNQHSTAGVGGSNDASVWVEVHAKSREKEIATNAKNYILSLCNDNGIPERYPPEFLDNLDLAEIGKETQAILIKNGRNEVCFKGDPMIVATARSLVDHKYQLFKQRNGDRNQSSSRVSDVRNLSRLPSHVSDLQQEMGRQDMVQDVVPDLVSSNQTDTTEQEDKPPKINLRQHTDATHLHTGRPELAPPTPPDLNRIDVIVPSRRKVPVSQIRDDVIEEDLSPYDGINVYNPPSYKSDHIDIKCKDRTSSLKPRQELVAHGCVGAPTKDVISSNHEKHCMPSVDEDEREFEKRTINNNKDTDRKYTEVENESLKTIHDPIDATIELRHRPEIKRGESWNRDLSKEHCQIDGTLNEPIERMEKLGYNRSQIEPIVHKLGPNATTNDILGCLVSQSKSTASEGQKRESRALDRLDVQENRIKDVSDSSSVLAPSKDDVDNLRPIIIDGSNVAMSFGNKDVFACKGIEIVVNWFLTRGHREIFVFVPNWRKEAAKPDTPITDQDILDKLNKLQILVFTPSRRINGRRVVCYDDRYIIKTAVTYDGIVVSNDNFRDLQNEQPEFKKVIEERLLMYSFVGNQFMPPDDPLGRHGPSLDNFLRKRPTAPDHPPQQCPYGKKCTYGNKCKYYHPERPGYQKSTSEKLKELDEARKRERSLGALNIDDYKLDNYTGIRELSSHGGAHTEPIPKSNGMSDACLPKQDQSKTGPLPGYTHPGERYRDEMSPGATYNRHASPHRASTYREVHPPPHFHKSPERSGYYSTEPILGSGNSPAQYREQQHGTVPLAHMRHSGSASARHSSLSMDGATGGPYSDLMAEMDKLAISGASSAYNPGPGRPVIYPNPPQISATQSTRSAPLSRPDMRSYAPPNIPHQPPIGGYGHSGNPNLPHGSHPLHHGSQYHPSYQGSGHHGQATSMPLRMPHQQIYPPLPSSQDAPINSYPMSQNHPRHRENIRSQTPPRAQPPATSDTSRRNFLMNYSQVYGQEAILEVLEKYPNETNHKRLCEYMQMHLRF